MPHHSKGIRKPIRLGIIGLGEIWKYQREALQGLSSYTISSGCDMDQSRKEFLPEGVRFVRDHMQFLQIGDMDAVLVSTPVSSHFNIGSDVLNHGLHLILEKPATQSMSEFESLSKLADDKGLILHVSFHAKYGKEITWLMKQYLNSDEQLRILGHLRSFFSGFYDSYISEVDVQKKFNSLGGSWLDSGVNALSVASSFVDINTGIVEDALIARVPQYPADVSTLVRVAFRSQVDNEVIRAIFHTAWDVGSSNKKTHLFFDNPEKSILLDHKRQSAYLMNGHTEERTLCDFSSKGNRLVNHYKGVFNSFSKSLDSNLDEARPIHRILFEAREQSGCM